MLRGLNSASQHLKAHAEATVSSSSASQLGLWAIFTVIYKWVDRNGQRAFNFRGSRLVEINKACESSKQDTEPESGDYSWFF